MEVFFFFQAEDGIRDIGVTGVQTCALPILSHARHGLYDLRARRVALDLRPQPAYVDVYVAACEGVRARRDGLAYLGPAEGLPRPAHQQRKDLELRRREIQRPPVPADGVRPGVELQRPEPHG